MSRFFLILFFFFITHFMCAQKYSLKHEGKKRKYLLHLPAGYQAGQKYPLVLNFHGILGYPRQQMRYSGMNRVADKNGFIVVYPKGLNHFWNTGLGKISYIDGRDDVGFIKELLLQLSKDYFIDTLRTYSCGLSMGGYFTYRLACELENRFAAIASVGGVISDSTVAHCHTSQKIPVLQIHGTHDPIVKYGGIKQSNGVEETVAFWVKHNQCIVNADTVTLPDLCTKDKSSVSLLKYSACDKGAEVYFYKIRNGGHTWPGTRINYIITGRINKDINGSEVIWDFFKRFSLQKKIKEGP